MEKVTCIPRSNLSWPVINTLCLVKTYFLIIKTLSDMGIGLWTLYNIFPSIEEILVLLYVDPESLYLIILFNNSLV
jgi:hypothetical protein